MSYPQPDALVRDALAGAVTLPDATTFSFTAATNLFTGPPRASNEGTTSDPSAFVEVAGGPPPIPYFAVGGVNLSLHEARLQITVRSSPDAYDQGVKIGLAIRTKLHTLAIAGLISCLAMDSAPQFIGQDDAKRYRWLLNFGVRWQQ